MAGAAQRTSAPAAELTRSSLSPEDGLWRAARRGRSESRLGQRTKQGPEASSVTVAVVMGISALGSRQKAGVSRAHIEDSNPQVGLERPGQRQGPRPAASRVP